MKTHKIERRTAAWALFEWSLRTHTHWQILASEYCSSRKEFEEKCDGIAISEAEKADDSPSILDREEFLTCEYYSAAHARVPANAKFVVANSRDDVEFFDEEDSANCRYTELMKEYGYELLTRDEGGHAGETNVVRLKNIEIDLWIDGERIRFEFDCEDTVSRAAVEETLAGFDDEAEFNVDQIYSKIERIVEELRG